MVKYRGMIQDILNPEYYLSVYEEQHKQTGQKVRGKGTFPFLSLFVSFAVFSQGYP